MRLLTFLTLVLAFSCTNHLFGQQKIASANIKTLQGETVDLADIIKEKDLTVISFWATWCKPCQAELDAIADLYPDWQDDLGVQLVAITIDTQRQLSKVPGILSTKGWEYNVYSDANNVLKNQLGFQAIPQTYVVDSEGNILYSHSGYSAGDEYDLEDKLKELADK
ncbi:TlpA family protein disulfide reductase [Lewinella cohaerens]|uniref:TlpA family protein disulfide reductase n=1 Tax=Lewinella cohaerens TaxID=70995 RepID=UPI0003803064|nr:TlpA disulfide reductase family protein [Lewinella cohaerens]